MSKLLSLNENINKQYPTKDKVVANIDIGSTNTKLSLVKNGQILVTRISEIGYKRIEDKVKEDLEYPEDQIHDLIFGLSNIDLEPEDDSDESKLINIIRRNVQGIIDSMDIVFRYYSSRDRQNVIDYIVMQGQFSNLPGLDAILSNHFNIPAIKLEALDKVRWDGNIGRYANAIGGLIRAEGVLR